MSRAEARGLECGNWREDRECFERSTKESEMIPHCSDHRPAIFAAAVYI